ncbi:MAG TPA: sugar nucleotide-binding protein, partial [Actinomycetota bacterium]|nr:sugar nucleotide-binding protein [Actinomycetota bacterium]
VAQWLRDIAKTGRSEHPVLAQPGWWRRPERLLYPAVKAGWPAPRLRPEPRRRARLLIVGEAGSLLEELRTDCDVRGLHATVVAPEPMAESVERLADDAWAVIDAGSDEGPARQIAEATHRLRKRLVSFSSDLVFSGCSGAPYVEHVAPGRNEWAERERLVLDLNPEALIIRTGPFFGGTEASDDSIRLEWNGRASPTYLPDAVNETLDLLVDGERGVWHVANRGSATFTQFAAMRDAISGKAGSDMAGLRPVEQAASDDTSLISERGSVLPLLEDALIRYLGKRKHRGFPLVTDEWLAAASAEPGVGG